MLLLVQERQIEARKMVGVRAQVAKSSHKTAIIEGLLYGDVGNDDDRPVPGRKGPLLPSRRVLYVHLQYFQMTKVCGFE